MSTTIYRVAYPNPKIRPMQRVCVCSVDSTTSYRQLCSQLCDEYPDYIEDLKRAIFYKASGLSYAEATSESTRTVYDWIRNNDPGAEIPRFLLLVECFPNGPHNQSEKQVDIVVVTPDIIESMEGDAVYELKYMKARKDLLRAFRRAPSPSDSVKSPAAIEDTVSNPSGPRYGRPSHRFGPPTALFSEPLAYLKYNLEHLELFTPEPVMLDHAFNLVTTATGFVGDESVREAALEPVLESLLMDRNEWQREIRKKSSTSDGVWFKGIFAYLIVGLKDEPGLHGDPFLQGLVVYSKIIAQEKYATYLERSNVPVVLLAIAGNRLIVSTAVFTNAIYADELFSTTLHLGPHGPDNVLRTARVFMAINDSTSRLRRLYDKLVSTPLPLQELAKPLWPNPTPDPPESAERPPKLEFFCKVNRADGAKLTTIDEENERHAMYLARMQTKTSTEVVFVKFATKYHEAAHRLLTDEDPPLAPALYSCTRVIGDMYMVVMEYIPASRGCPMDRHSRFIGSSAPQLAIEVVDRDVSKALGLLHARNLVFGDLRETNLLYLPEDGGRVLLVDFDGVGRDGIDRYSTCLNPEAGLGVARGQIMEKSHDRENLERLMERLKTP